MSSENLEMRFKGGKLKPECVPLHELAEVLKAIEDVVAESLVAEGGVAKDDLLLGLVSVRGESVDLGFSTSHLAKVVAVLAQIGFAIGSREFRKLPPRTVEPLQVIHKFVEKHDCVAAIHDLQRPTAALLEITPDTEILPFLSTVKGKTVLYGRVVQVGGKSEGKAVIETSLATKSIKCTAKVDILRELGRRLYMNVGVSGEAEWNAADLSICSFHIEEVLAYEETPIDIAIARLREAVGNAYDDIDDVPGLVSRLRHGEEEGS